MAKIRTRSGRLVDPFNPVPEDVFPPDMIHSICCLSRFTGQAKYPYSIGQHSLVLCGHVPEELKRAALVHDFAESWFNDLASPVKHELWYYKRAEKRAMYFIAEQLGVSAIELDKLDIYDKRIYVNERNALFDNIDELGMGDEYTALPIPKINFGECDWRDVRTVFNHTFVYYFPERNDYWPM